MDVLELIDKLDDLIHNARAVPLTDQVRIDREAIYDLLDQMRSTIPEEVKQARWIVKERQEMLAEAKREAERLVADARDKAAQEASEQEVVKRAEREAAEILEEARQREREVRLGAEDYADEVLGTLEVNLGKFLQAVQRGRERLQGRSEDAARRRRLAEPLEPAPLRPPWHEGVATLDLRSLRPAPGAADPARLRRPARSRCASAARTTAPSPRSPSSTSTVSARSRGCTCACAAHVDLVGPCWRCLADARVHLDVDSSEFPPTAATRTRPSTRTSTPSTSTGDALDLATWARDAVAEARPGHDPLPRGLRRPVPDVRRRPQRGPLRLRRRRSTTRAGTRLRGRRGAARRGRAGPTPASDLPGGAFARGPARYPSASPPTGGEHVAVPKRKTSKQRRDTRRATHAIEATRLGRCPRCSEPGAPAPRVRRLRLLPRPPGPRDRG